MDRKKCGYPGSIVTKNILDNTVTAGNRCHVIRIINEKEKWEREYEDYIKENQM